MKNIAIFGGFLIQYKKMDEHPNESRTRDKGHPLK